MYFFKYTCQAYFLEQELVKKKLSVKGQIRNIIGFVVHSVFIAMTHLAILAKK